MNRALWIAQSLLSVLFLFAGIAKLAAPIQPMADQAGLPARLLLFVAIMEVLGAVGLILPGLVHVATKLVPLAAIGLVIIMIGAVTVTLRTEPAALAILPFVTGIGCIFVAYGRWRLVPLR